MKNRVFHKRLIFIIGIFLMITMISASQQPNEVNLTTLLNEMVDREQITRFPESGYQCLQASSYNRESVSPDKPGWFADSDGINFIRIEENSGQTYLLM